MERESSLRKNLQIIGGLASTFIFFALASAAIFLDFSLDSLSGLVTSSAAVISAITSLIFSDKVSDTQSMSIVDRDSLDKGILARVQTNWIDSQLLTVLSSIEPINVPLKIRLQDTAKPRSDLINLLDIETDSSQILQLFHDMQSRLLILGKPESGKSILMLRLCQQLIEQAQEGRSQAIPVVLDFANWSKNWRARIPFVGISQKDLFEDWVLRQLEYLYDIPGHLAKHWLYTDRLILLLDNLDAVETRHQRACLQSLNAFLSNPCPALVICCESEAYETMSSADSQSGLSLKLDMGGAVSTEVISTSEVTAYLSAEAFSGIRYCLEHDESLHEQLMGDDYADSRLTMLNLTAIAYQGKSPVSLVLPSENDNRLHHIYQMYCNRMIHRRGRYGFDWKSNERYLAWFAQHYQVEDAEGADSLPKDSFDLRQNSVLTEAIPDYKKFIATFVPILFLSVLMLPFSLGNALVLAFFLLSFEIYCRMTKPLRLIYFPHRLQVQYYRNLIAGGGMATILGFVATQNYTVEEALSLSFSFYAATMMMSLIIAMWRQERANRQSLKTNTRTLSSAVEVSFLYPLVIIVFLIILRALTPEALKSSSATFTTDTIGILLFFLFVAPGASDLRRYIGIWIAMRWSGQAILPFRFSAYLDFANETGFIKKNKNDYAFRNTRLRTYFSELNTNN